MHIHWRSQRVQAVGCLALHSLVGPEAEHLGELGSRDAVAKLVLGALQSVRGVPEVQRRGCILICYLLGDELGRASIRAEINAALEPSIQVDAFDGQVVCIPESAWICHGSRVMIAPLCRVGGDLRFCVQSQLGMSDVAVTAMRSFPEFVPIQAAGLAALESLARRGHEQKAEVLANGGLEWALASSRTFLSSPNVQVAAVGVWFSLLVAVRFLEPAEPNEVVVDGDGGQTFLRSSGLPSLIASLAAYPTCAPLQERGLTLLRALLPCADDVLQTLLDLGGVRMVLASTRNNLGRETVQGDGCALLAAAARADKTHLTEIAARGGAEVVLAAMKAHPAARGVQSQACTALRDLVTPPPPSPIGSDAEPEVEDIYKDPPPPPPPFAPTPAGRLLERSGALELIIDSLRLHLVEDVQEPALSLLLLLAEHGGREAKRTVRESQAVNLAHHAATGGHFRHMPRVVEAGAALEDFLR